METGYDQLNRELNTRVSKLEKVRRHLRKHGNLTTLECIELYRYLRLSDGIMTLRRSGWNIRTDLLPTADGLAKYANYVLVDSPEGK